MDRRTIITFLLIIVFALSLRLYFLGQDNLTTYEFGSIFVAHNYLANANYFSAQTSHHPLYYYFLYWWMRLWNSAYTAGKLLSVVWGTLLVIAIILSAFLKEGVLTKGDALFASFVVTISPIHIFFSHYISLYAFFTLIVFLSNISFMLFLKKDKLRYSIGYVFFTTLMLYTQICGYIMLMIQAASFLFMGRKAKKWLAVILVIIGLYLPWHALAFPYQMRVWQTGSPGMKAAVRYDPPLPTLETVWQTLIDYSAGSPLLLFLFFLVILYGIIKNRRDLSTSLFLLLWSIIPVLVLYLVSLHVDSIYKHKELLFVSVPIFLLVGRGFAYCNKGIKAVIIIAIAFASLLQLASISYRQAPERWRELVSAVSKIRAPSDLVIAFHDQEPLRYYYRDRFCTAGSITSLKVAVTAEKGNSDRLLLIMRLDNPAVNSEAIEYLKGDYTLLSQQEYAYDKPKYGENCAIAYYLFGRKNKTTHTD